MSSWWCFEVFSTRKNFKWATEFAMIRLFLVKRSEFMWCDVENRKIMQLCEDFFKVFMKTCLVFFFAFDVYPLRPTVNTFQSTLSEVLLSTIKESLFLRLMMFDVKSSSKSEETKVEALNVNSNSCCNIITFLQRVLVIASVALCCQST